jgi:hypothetical protein
LWLIAQFAFQLCSTNDDITCKAANSGDLLSGVTRATFNFQGMTREHMSSHLVKHWRTQRWMFRQLPLFLNSGSGKSSEFGLALLNSSFILPDIAATIVFRRRMVCLFDLVNPMQAWPPSVYRLAGSTLVELCACCPWHRFSAPAPLSACINRRRRRNTQHVSPFLKPSLLNAFRSRF